MFFLGLNMRESTSTRGSGTSTTAVCTSILAVAPVGWVARVSALNNVVFPDCGRPIIPRRMGLNTLTLLGILRYTHQDTRRSGGTGRRARVQNVYPPGMWVRFPPSAPKL